MQSTNKKILRTKTALRNAFFSLIESKSMQEISVSQLCRAANINRTTFYKYYSLPIDILNEYLMEIYEQSLKPIHMKNGILSEKEIYDILLQICLMYYENKQIVKIYMEFNKEFFSILQRSIGKNINTGLKENSLISFISGGVSAIILQWSLNDYKQSPEDIAKLITGYIAYLNSYPVKDSVFLPSNEDRPLTYLK